MALTRRGNTNLSTETKIGLTNQITRIRTEAKTKKEITKANIGIRTRTDTNIVQAPLRTRKSMIAIKTKTRRAHLRAKTRSIKVAAHPAKIKIKIRARTRNIITSRAQVRRIKTGKMQEKGNFDVRV